MFQLSITLQHTNANGKYLAYSDVLESRGEQLELTEN